MQSPIEAFFDGLAFPICLIPKRLLGQFHLFTFSWLEIG